MNVNDTVQRPVADKIIYVVLVTFQHSGDLLWGKPGARVAESPIELGLFRGRRKGLEGRVHWVAMPSAFSFSRIAWRTYLARSTSFFRTASSTAVRRLIGIQKLNSLRSDFASPLLFMDISVSWVYLLATFFLFRLAAARAKRWAGHVKKLERRFSLPKKRKRREAI